MLPDCSHTKVSLALPGLGRPVITHESAACSDSPFHQPLPEEDLNSACYLQQEASLRAETAQLIQRKKHCPAGD
jgi:hypothetical protein